MIAAGDRFLGRRREAKQKGDCPTYFYRRAVDRTRLDAVVAVLLTVIVAIGATAAWQQYRQLQAHGDMMGHSMGHGLHPSWYLLGSVVLAGAVAVIYWIVRDQMETDAGRRARDRSPAADPETHDSSSPSTTGAESTPTTGAESTPQPDSAIDPSPEPAPQLLSVLPADERRILEPIVESPGLTQIALRDRADFSKSKVSQTVTDLEKRGLLYREPQGRTYRIYPSDDLEKR